MTIHNFKVSIEDDSTDEQVRIKVIFSPKNNEEIKFRFNNDNKSFEKMTLKVYDSTGKRVKNTGQASVSGKIGVRQFEGTISPDKPHVYTMFALKELIDYWEPGPDGLATNIIPDKGMQLWFGTIVYTLKRDETYYFQLNDFDTLSNKIAIKLTGGYVPEEDDDDEVD